MSPAGWTYGGAVAAPALLTAIVVLINLVRPNSEAGLLWVILVPTLIPAALAGALIGSLIGLFTIKRR